MSFPNVSSFSGLRVTKYEYLLVVRLAACCSLLLANVVFLLLTVVLLVNTVSYALFCLDKSCRLYFYSNSLITHIALLYPIFVKFCVFFPN